MGRIFKKPPSVPEVKVGDVVYIKYDVPTDKGSVKVWYKGRLIKVITSDHAHAYCKFEFITEDKKEKEFEKVHLDFSNFGSTWRFTKPLGYKRSHDEIDMDDVVYDLYDEVKRMFAEERLALEKLFTEKLKNIKVNEKSRFVQGDFTQEAVDLFNELDRDKQQKFYAGGMTAVVNSDAKKTMCAYYKCLVPHLKCASRKEENSKWVSNPASKVDLCRFGELGLRDMECADVNKIIKTKSLCAACVSKHCKPKQFMEYDKATSCCIICKVCRVSNSNEKGSKNLPVCTKCSKRDNADGYEALFKKGISVLTKVFAQYEMHIEQNTVVKYEGKTYRIDLLIKGTCEGMRFAIIIELDQNQHKGMCHRAERKKMCEQTAYLLKNDGVDKVFMIRANHNVGWREKGGDALVNYYDSKEKVLIMRSWICWYLVHFKGVRNCVILYLWYDYDKREKLLGHKFDGFGMCNGAPQANNWKYCVDPSEMKANFDGVNNRRVALNEVFKCWELEHQNKENMYPTGIKKLLGI